MWRIPLGSEEESAKWWKLEEEEIEEEETESAMKDKQKKVAVFGSRFVCKSGGKTMGREDED